MPADTLPKVELHLHLDCSLDFEGVRRLRPAITVEEYRRDFVLPSHCPNLAAFLVQVPNALRLLQTRDALGVLVENVFEQLERDRVIYAELRFAPLLHTAHGLSPEQVVDTVDAAVDDMVDRTGIDARIILWTLRHFTEEQSLATVALVRRFRDRRVAALDLAGDEAGFPLQPHVAAFRAAHDWGLQTTAHAGEACGPTSVWETLRELQPARIGHGIRSIEDPALIDHLRRVGLHLEICPSSNIQLVESVTCWADHPIDALWRHGVSLSVSTDIRAFINTTLTREYTSIQQRSNSPLRLHAARATTGSATDDGWSRRR
jgi:adenosine deaminase